MSHRQRSRRSRRTLAAAVAILALLYGCTEDSVGTFNAPDETSEVGMPDTGPSEDTRPVPDTNIESDAEVVPQSPADNAYCNQNDWCWIHPAPLPHRVSDLQRVDDRVFGVARSLHLKGFQPLVWDGEQMTLLPKPVPPAEELADMTTSNSGWLAIGNQGTVYDIGTQGVRQTRELSVEFPGAISGTGIDTFVTHGSGEVLVMRDGRLTREDPGEGRALRPTFMWPNGDMLRISEGGEFGGGTFETRFNGRWRSLPWAPKDPDEELNALGPNPELACASEGMFLGTQEVTFDGSVGRLYRWDPALETFTDATYEGTGLRSIGCTPEGQLLLTNDSSQLLVRTGTATPFWERTSPTDEPVDETEVVGNTLYASSSQGDHAVLSGEDLLRVGSGFRVPQLLDPIDEPLGLYSHFWISDDAESMVLSHDRGLFLGTEDGWSRMAASSDYDFENVQDARVWGFNEPRFAAENGTFWRWDGDLWINITQEVFGTSYQPVGDIFAFGPDDFWMRADGDVFHYDGRAWTNVSAPGSPVSRLLEEEDLEMNRLLTTGDRTLLFGAEGSLYRLQREGEEWSITLKADTPCDLVTAIFEAGDGRLWVFGRDKECIASRQGSTWTEYTWPDDQRVPPKARLVDERVEWVKQPASNVPLLITRRGILEPQSDGTFETRFVGVAWEGVHVESRDVTLVLTAKGVVANYE